MDTTTPSPGNESETSVRIGHIDDLAVGAMRMARIDGHRVCVVRTPSGVYAVDQACPHEGYGLTTGSLDGELITCAWHNWKFRAADGTCVVGEEDVANHQVTIADDGTISVELAVADPEVQRQTLSASLVRAMDKHYLGQIARDVVRLLHAGATPAEIVAIAVNFGAPRGEYGWGHDLASLTDCLAMVPLYDGDDVALPITQAIAGVAESNQRRAPRPLAEPVAVLPTDPRAAFGQAVEAEILDDAQALIGAALRDGVGSDELVSWFLDVVCAHHLSYGHGAIYVQKAFQLLEMIGWDHAEVVLGHLVTTLVYATREDTLPYMRPFIDAIESFNGDERPDAPRGALDGGPGRCDEFDEAQRTSLVNALLGPDRASAASATRAALDNGCDIEEILDQFVVAASIRLLRYDTTGEDDLLDDFNWLDITHALTYANAIRWLGAQRPRTAAYEQLVLWGAFLVNWTGRHEWHTQVGEIELPIDVDRSVDLLEALDQPLSVAPDVRLPTLR